jgi:hypothetical protein
VLALELLVLRGESFQHLEAIARLLELFLAPRQVVLQRLDLAQLGLELARAAASLELLAERITLLFQLDTAPLQLLDLRERGLQVLAPGRFGFQRLLQALVQALAPGLEVRDTLLVLRGHLVATRVERRAALLQHLAEGFLGLVDQALSLLERAVLTEILQRAVDRLFDQLENLPCTDHLDGVHAFALQIGERGFLRALRESMLHDTQVILLHGSISNVPSCLVALSSAPPFPSLKQDPML